MGESQPQIPQDRETADTTDASSSKKRRRIFGGKGLAIFGAAAVATGVGAAVATSGGERAQPDKPTTNETVPGYDTTDGPKTPQTEQLGPMTVDSSTESSSDASEDQQGASEERKIPEFPKEDVLGDGIPNQVPGVRPESDLVIEGDDGTVKVIPKEEVVVPQGGVSGGVSVEQSDQPVSGGVSVEAIPQQTPGPVEGGAPIDQR